MDDKTKKLINLEVEKNKRKKGAVFIPSVANIPLKEPVTIYLKTGRWIHGIVERVTSYEIVVNDGRTMMILFKHSIDYIILPREEQSKGKELENLHKK